MAILDAQAWSSAVDADTDTVFDRQQRWDAFDPCRFDASDGPLGNGVWSPNQDNDHLRIDGSWGLSTIMLAAWIFCDHALAIQPMQLFEGSFGTLHVYVQIDINGQVQVYRAGGNDLAESSNLIVLGQWNHIALRAVIHDTTGEVQVEVNGNEWINETGLDTRNGGTSGIIDSIKLEGGSNYSVSFAEPIIFSAAGDAPTALFGMHHVHMIKPDGETSVQFTPQGAGTNDVEVDEQAADDDTTYNESSTVTNKDKLTTEALPTAVNKVYAVQGKVLVKDPDGTATESVKIGLDSGTESLSAAQALSTGYEQFEGPMETVDPNTSSAWTEANVNATDVVYEHA